LLSNREQVYKQNLERTLSECDYLLLLLLLFFLKEKIRRKTKQNNADSDHIARLQGRDICCGQGRDDITKMVSSPWQQRVA
jgi:hypothetical protein